MARSSIRSRSVTRSGNGAIHIVVKESGGELYLDPKPGGERVRQGCILLVVASNLTIEGRDVAVTFGSGMDAKRNRKFELAVAKNGAKSKAIHLRDDFFEGNSTADVLLVRYEVTVGGTVVDPDLEIER